MKLERRLLALEQRATQPRLVRFFVLRPGLEPQGFHARPGPAQDGTGAFEVAAFKGMPHGGNTLRQRRANEVAVRNRF